MTLKMLLKFHLMILKIYQKELPSPVNAPIELLGHPLLLVNILVQRTRILQWYRSAWTQKNTRHYLPGLTT